MLYKIFINSSKGDDMKIKLLLLLLLFALSLFAEDPSKAKVINTEKQQEKEEVLSDTEHSQSKDTKLSEDIFIDKDGDGIADNRNFKERKKGWHRSSSLSNKVFGCGTNTGNQKCQPGKNTSGHGSGNGGGNGNGSGGGGGG